MGYFSDNLPGQNGGISTTPEPIDLNQNLEETSGESEEASNTGTNDPLSALKNNLVENSPNAGNPQVTQETAFEQPDTQAGGNGPSKFAAGSFQVSSFILPENIQKALDFELQTFSDLTSKTVSEIEDAGRVQALAVFTQPRLDFDVVSQTGTKVYNSNLYSSIEQALVEDRISRYFSKALFQKALVSDSAFFNSAQASVDENLAAAQNIIDTLDDIFAELRSFDSVLLQGATEPFSKNSSLQKMLEIGSLEPLREGESFYTSKLFSSAKNIVVDVFSNFDTNAQVMIQNKSQTAMLAMNLGLLQEFLKKGFAINNLIELSLPFGTVEQQNDLFADSYLVNVPAIPFNIESYKDCVTYEGLKGESSTPAYEDKAAFSNINYIDTKSKTVFFTSMLANEFLNSAGLARVIGTPLGNKFGANTNDSAEYAINFCGIEKKSVEEETSYTTSLYDDLLVTKNGSARVETSSGESGVLLLDGSRYGKKTSNSTDEFAISVISDPLTNDISNFSAALKNAKSNSTDALQYYKKIQCRDQQPSILTPRALYTRILEEISKSLEVAASGAADSNKRVVFELGLMTYLGRQAYSNDQTRPANRLRSLMFDAFLKIAYSILQPNVAAKNVAATQEVKKTKVVIEQPGESKKELTVSTQDISEKKSDPADASNQDITKIRLLDLSDSDIKRLAEEIPAPYGSMLGAILTVDQSPDLTQIAGTRATVRYDFVDFITKEIFEDSNLLIFRLAQIFLDCHEEALNFAGLENNAANFIGVDRRTNSNRLNGSSLMSLLFETTTKLCSLFCQARLEKNKLAGIPEQQIDFYSFAALDYKGFINATKTLDDIEGAIFTLLQDVKKIQLTYSTGENSRNGIAYRALKLLVECSKSNTFDSAYGPDGSIPQLEAENDSVIITAEEDGENAFSFLAFRQVMEQLSEQRDLPMASLLAHDSYIDYIEQNTSGLVSIANQILGNENRTETVQSFVDFAQSSIGKKYLKLGKNETATDRSVNISRIRYNKLVRQNQDFTKRLQRITAGELACVREVFKEFYQTPSETLVMPVVGLPAGMAKDYIIPKFGILQGFSTPPDQMTIIIKIRAAKVFDEQVIGTIYRQLMLDEILDGFSFINFNLSQPPTGMQDIIENVVLIDGRSGGQFIQDSIDQDRARVILKNEVMSYLARKAMSIISPIDLFAEDISDESSEETKRSSFSQTLAASFASVYGLPEDYFNEVFGFVSGLGERRIVLPKMLDLTKPTSTQNLNRKPLSFGEAEMFTDVFSNLYFKSEQIVERVFEQVVFEKLMCLPFSPDEFPSYEDYALKGEDINFPSNNPNQYTTDFAKFDPTVAKFRFNTYEMFITPGTTLGKK